MIRMFRTTLVGNERRSQGKPFFKVRRCTFVQRAEPLMNTGKNKRWTIDSGWKGKGEGGSHRGIFKILNLNWKVDDHKRLLHDTR